ncbi:TPA: hypothetical protein N0F65_011412, partial [Lagenidium giganteum]
LATEPNSSKFAIDAHNRGVEQVEDLSELPKLCALDVSFNRLTSLRNIATAKELRELKIYHNKLTSTVGLRGNSLLEGLLMHDNYIEAMSDDFQALVKLKTLWLNGNRITEVRNLRSCRALVHLDLSRNQIGGVVADGLESLISLEYLNVSGNQFKSLGNLSHMVKLDELNVSDNCLATLGGLYPPELTILRANGNDLNEVATLPVLPKLNELYIQNNTISDVSALPTKCPLLESLDLRNNAIRSAEKLGSWMSTATSLQDLWLDGNPCCASPSYILQVTSNISELKTLDTLVDESLKIHIESLKSGNGQSRPFTPSRPRTATSRPGSASSTHRPNTPNSRPGTPDGAPVFYKPSARIGNLVKVASAIEIERAQQDVHDQLVKVKMMLEAVSDERRGAPKAVLAATKPKAVTSPETSVSKKSQSRQPWKESEPIKGSARSKEERLPSSRVPELVQEDAPKEPIASVSISPAKQPQVKKSMADAGTNPLDTSNMSYLPSSRRSNAPQTNNSEIQTETEVLLPPAPPVYITEQDPEKMGRESSPEEEDVGEEMKQTLLQYVREDNQRSAEEHARKEKAMESPRIVSAKQAEQRKAPTPASRVGYRSFRLPSRDRSLTTATVEL